MLLPGPRVITPAQPAMDFQRLGLLLAAVLGLGLGMLWVIVILPELLGWTLA